MESFIGGKMFGDLKKEVKTAEDGNQRTGEKLFIDFEFFDKKPKENCSNFYDRNL